MAPFGNDNDVIPFARNSARYLYRNGYGPDQVAQALTEELDVEPRVARTIAVEVKRAVAA